MSRRCPARFLQLLFSCLTAWHKHNSTALLPANDALPAIVSSQRGRGWCGGCWNWRRDNRRRRGDRGGGRQVLQGCGASRGARRAGAASTPAVGGCIGRQCMAALRAGLQRKLLLWLGSGRSCVLLLLPAGNAGQLCCWLAGNQEAQQFLQGRQRLSKLIN